MSRNTTHPDDYLARPLFKQEWDCAAQVFVICQRVPHPLNWRQPTVSGISSLTPEQASPGRLLECMDLANIASLITAMSP